MQGVGRKRSPGSGFGVGPIGGLWGPQREGHRPEATTEGRGRRLDVGGGGERREEGNAISERPAAACFFFTVKPPRKAPFCPKFPSSPHPASVRGALGVSLAPHPAHQPRLQRQIEAGGGKSNEKIKANPRLLRSARRTRPAVFLPRSSPGRGELARGLFRESRSELEAGGVERRGPPRGKFGGGLLKEKPPR